MRTCDIEGCERKHEARGLCKMHDARRRKHGSPQADKPAQPRRRDPICSVDGCGLPHHSHGYCTGHKMKLWRFGDTESRVRVAQPKPNAGPKRSPIRRAIEAGDGAALLQAILADTSLTETGCREWQRSVDTSGYARCIVNGKSYGVHRLVMEAIHGPLHNEPVHHSCANRKCVEPTHLQRVTQFENVAEMLARRWFEERITRLEAALLAVAPTHELLRTCHPAA